MKYLSSKLSSSSEPESISLDVWRSSGGTWGHAFYDPPPVTWDPMNRTADLGQNRDEMTDALIAGKARYSSISPEDMSPASIRERSARPEPRMWD